jgi:hypothetical protein
LLSNARLGGVQPPNSVFKMATTRRIRVVDPHSPLRWRAGIYLVARPISLGAR